MDSPASIERTFESHEYIGLDLIDERKNNIKNVTFEDVVNLAKKVHIDTIYVLEGGSDEKNNN